MQVLASCSERPGSALGGSPREWQSASLPPALHPPAQQAAQLRPAAQQQQPLALLLAPTRELAVQIGHACKPLRSLFGLHSTFITGGADKQQQLPMHSISFSFP